MKIAGGALAVVGVAACFFALAPRIARAAESAEDEPSNGENVEGSRRRRAPRIDPFEEAPGYLQLQGSFFVGDGLRFNNPYRLATPLGADAESVSRTSPYVDLGGALLVGRALGFQHGPAIRCSFATEGVPQAVFTPSYLLYRRFRSLAAYGRVGIPIVATPDLTTGGELGIGGIFFFRGGIGVAAEVVGDLIWGANTRDVQRPLYPILSGQIGIVVALEVLP